MKTLSDSECSTILAALRWWQRTGGIPGTTENDIACEYGVLSDVEIDSLCEEINV